MKAILTILLMVCFNSVFAQQQTDSLKMKAENNQNPAKWDKVLFEGDKSRWKNMDPKPLNTIAFPVEEYDFYVFSKPFKFQTNDGNFSGISFGVNVEGNIGKRNYKYEINLIFYLGDKDIEMDGYVGSRNYPYLTVQGSTALKDRYDFVAVKAPDEPGFLIVNMKTFDLRYGKTIIIFPNADNSFHYLQLNDNPKNEEDFSHYLNAIKANTKMEEMVKLVR